MPKPEMRLMAGYVRIAAANRPPENPPAASAVWGISTVQERQIAIKEPRHLSIKVTNQASNF
ncbi:MAG: hypothetical protein ACLP4V_09460 [Methylocella sp.]